MKKHTEDKFKNLLSQPIRTQSPDYKGGNIIKSTKSPRNLDHSADIHINYSHERTPTKSYKGYQTPKKQRSTGHKYFSTNRGVNSGNEHYYHEQNPSSMSNEEVILELRRIIKMINSERIDMDSLEPENTKIREQVKILQVENHRLLQLIDQLQIKSQSIMYKKHEALENELIGLRQQMSRNLSEYEKDREQLLRSNQTMSVQIKSFDDQRRGLEKQIQELRYLLKQKQRQLYYKNEQRIDVTSLRDQYTQNIKALKNDFGYELEQKARGMEESFALARRKVDRCEQRINHLERLKNQNSELLLKIESMRREKSMVSNRGQIEGLSKELSQARSQFQLLSEKYSSLMRSKNDQQRIYSLKYKQIEEDFIDKLRAKDGIIHSKDVLISDLKGQISRIKSDSKVSQSLENRIFDLTLKIQEKERQSETLQSRIVQITENHERQLKSLRRELESRASKSVLLSNRESQLEKEVMYLKEQLENCRRCNLRETETYQKRIAELQSKIVSLTSCLDQSESKILKYDELLLQIQQKNSEISRLVALIQQYQQSQVKVSHYESMLDNLRGTVRDREEEIVRLQSESKLRGQNQSSIKERYEYEIGQLTARLKQMQSNYNIIYQTIGSLRDERSMVQEIKQLKRMVSETKVDKLELQLLRFSQLYQREVKNTQDLMKELERSKIDLKNMQESLINSQKNCYHLEERVRVLQGHNQIIENQLREKKQACQSIARQKSQLESEILTMKKIKLDHGSVEGTKAKARLISEKVDRLLVLEQEREKSISQITYSIHQISKSPRR